MVLVMIVPHCEVNPYSGSLSSRLRMKSNSSAEKETVFTAIFLFICLFICFFSFLFCHTGGERLHREPSPCKKRHVLEGPPLSAMLQVVLFKLRQRKKTLHHPLILDVYLREKGTSSAFTLESYH